MPAVPPVQTSAATAPDKRAGSAGPAAPPTPASWRIGPEALSSPFSAAYYGYGAVRRESHTLLDQTSAELLRACQRVSELEAEVHRAHAVIESYKAEMDLRRQQSEALLQEVADLQDELLRRHGRPASSPTELADAGRADAEQRLAASQDRVAQLEEEVGQLRAEWCAFLEPPDLGLKLA